MVGRMLGAQIRQVNRYREKNLRQPLANFAILISGVQDASRPRAGPSPPEIFSKIRATHELP